MKNPRDIKYIVVHCTATPPNTTIESMKRFWKDVRKWGDTPGYHYIIERNGNIVQLLDESKNSNGVYMHNSSCINMSYIGGIDKEGKPLDNRSDLQKHAMFDKIIELTERYPGAEVLGHRDFPDNPKACPCFDVREWLKNYEPDLDESNSRKVEEE
jgi:N-acetylmuramoyl-L-alanine amidase